MTIRIDSKLKREAFEVAEYYGLNLSSVTHFKQMVNMHRIPLMFAPEEPNDESLEAITEGDAFLASGRSGKVLRHKVPHRRCSDIMSRLTTDYSAAFSST